MSRQQWLEVLCALAAVPDGVEYDVYEAHHMVSVWMARNRDNEERTMVLFGRVIHVVG
jgi:hypothetical protein